MKTGLIIVLLLLAIGYASITMLMRIAKKTFHDVEFMDED